MISKEMIIETTLSGMDLSEGDRGKLALCLQLISEKKAIEPETCTPPKLQEKRKTPNKPKPQQKAKAPDEPITGTLGKTKDIYPIVVDLIDFIRTNEINLSTAAQECGIESHSLYKLVQGQQALTKSQETILCKYMEQKGVAKYCEREAESDEDGSLG